MLHIAPLNILLLLQKTVWQRCHPVLRTYARRISDGMGFPYSARHFFWCLYKAHSQRWTCFKRACTSIRTEIQSKKPSLHRPAVGHPSCAIRAHDEALLALTTTHVASYSRLRSLRRNCEEYSHSVRAASAVDLQWHCRPTLNRVLHIPRRWLSKWRTRCVWSPPFQLPRDHRIGFGQLDYFMLYYATTPSRE